MKPILIGIAGPKRVGKNTAARLLRACLAEYDQDVLIGETAFADTFYDMLGCLVGHDTVDRLRDDDAKDTEILEPFGVTLRYLADTIGTEWGRDLVHPDIWVMALHRRVTHAAAKDAQGEPVVIFIPDVRKENEAQLVRDNGFLLHIQRNTDKQQSPHRSAIPLPVEDGDVVIENHGTLEEFEQKVMSYGRSTLPDDLTAAIRTSTGVGRLLHE